MRSSGIAALFFGALGALGAPAPARALIPPMSQNDLARDASLIIDGRVIKVVKVGKVTHDHCYGWQRMRALVAVDKSHKGAPGKTVWISYATRVEDRSKCVGGKTSYSLQLRHRYRLYLSCTAPPARAKRPRQRTCHFMSWSGVQHLPQGKQDPPPPKVIQPTLAPGPARKGIQPTRAPAR